MAEHDEGGSAEDHDRGLRFDLRTMSRRRMLLAAGGVGTLAVIGVGGKLLLDGNEDVPAADGSAAAGSCTAQIESETAGPFPADGSNGPDIRTVAGIVRRDIRTSFGTASGTAPGVPLTFSLTVQDLSCAPVAGAAIYVWHCDREGRYSLYSPGATDQNYLRGIQATDATGTATFTSIYPACYSGRWPHIHFEVYATLPQATSGTAPIVKTSQLALPESTDKEVYTTPGYTTSVPNLSRITLATDMVFGDDKAARELAVITGNVTSGYTAHLTVTIDPTTVDEGTDNPPPGNFPGTPGDAPPSPAP